MKKRLFVAVDLADDVRSQVAFYVDRLRERFPDARLGWTRPENLHLTLKFLGDVDEHKVSNVANAIRDAVSDLLAFDLEIAGTGVFPSARKARILWLGVGDASGGLVLAAGRIEDSLEQLGYPKEDRRFSPHLTIGRSRRDLIARESVEAHLAEPFGPVVFNIDRVALYESKLTPKGPIYTEINFTPLAGRVERQQAES